MCCQIFLSNSSNLWSIEVLAKIHSEKIHRFCSLFWRFRMAKKTTSEIAFSRSKCVPLKQKHFWDPSCTAETVGGIGVRWRWNRALKEPYHCDEHGFWAYSIVASVNVWTKKSANLPCDFGNFGWNYQAPIPRGFTSSCKLLEWKKTLLKRDWNGWKSPYHTISSSIQISSKQQICSSNAFFSELNL